MKYEGIWSYSLLKYALQVTASDDVSFLSEPLTSNIVPAFCKMLQLINIISKN